MFRLVWLNLTKSLLYEPFLLMSLFGRGLRFFIISFVVKKYGSYGINIIKNKKIIHGEIMALDVGPFSITRNSIATFFL